MIRQIRNLNQALEDIRAGLVLAYPTEAVYGLGCDAFNQNAVERILRLKRRSVEQGLILLISDWPQLFGLIDYLPIARLETIKQTWPGPVTWIFPKSKLVPDWISGAHDTIAVRMTAHPIAHKLCELGPIISTSANPHGIPPALSIQEVEHLFTSGLDGLVLGDLGHEKKPSVIFDALTQEQLR